MLEDFQGHLHPRNVNAPWRYLSEEAIWVMAYITENHYIIYITVLCYTYTHALCVSLSLITLRKRIRSHSPSHTIDPGPNM